LDIARGDFSSVSTGVSLVRFTCDGWDGHVLKNASYFLHTAADRFLCTIRYDHPIYRVCVVRYIYLLNKNAIMFRSLLLTNTTSCLKLQAWSPCRMTAIRYTSLRPKNNHPPTNGTAIPTVVRTLSSTTVNETTTAATDTSSKTSTSSPPRVVVLGTGWGGFNLVRYVVLVSSHACPAHTVPFGKFVHSFLPFWFFCKI
jgi:hypothetical protein